MEHLEKRLIAVRQGNVLPTGSWLYVWIDIADGSTAYIGSTGFDPELRTHLHLASEDPDHGRVRATVPRYQERDFDILAFKVPGHLSRSDVKVALVEQIAAGDPQTAETTDARTLDGVVGQIIDALGSYGNQLAGGELPDHRGSAGVPGEEGQMPEVRPLT